MTEGVALDWITTIHLYWKPAVEIGVFWFVFYLLFVYIKDSGMIQSLKGILFLVALFFVSEILMRLLRFMSRPMEDGPRR